MLGKAQQLGGAFSATPFRRYVITPSGELDQAREIIPGRSTTLDAPAVAELAYPVHILKHVALLRAAEQDTGRALDPRLQLRYPIRSGTPLVRTRARSGVPIVRGGLLSAAP
jgi:hypothetical protein